MRVLADGKFVASEEGGTWPTPMDEVHGGLEWRLRHGTKEQLVKDRYLAASIVSAYRQMIVLPAKQRDAVIRDLRAGIKATTSDAGVARDG